MLEDKVFQHNRIQSEFAIYVSGLKLIFGEKNNRTLPRFNKARPVFIVWLGLLITDIYGRSFRSCQRG